MSRTRKYNDKYRKDDEPRGNRGRQRRLSARGVRRDDPDLRRMGKALIAFALAEAEAEAERRRAAPPAASDEDPSVPAEESAG
jgi:hypothetical protein